VHPSNFRVDGFTASVATSELHELATVQGIPLVVDVGSGLLTADPMLPDEPAIDAALADGADVVTSSGDKLLGGPQAGLLLGRAEAIGRISRHPLARAVRADKLALAAVEATVAAGSSPVTEALHADPDRLRARAQWLADEIETCIGGRPEVQRHDGRVGGGGAPGVPLPGWAVRLPEWVAAPLRTGRPAVLPRVHDGCCLLDLRCIAESDDARLLNAVRSALDAGPVAGRPGAP
jgi:L-seryl-tRNA(Ser) seleniumtransferase